MSNNDVVDRDYHDQQHDEQSLAVDAHMPPQPGGDPVFANTWNPDTNEWAPTNEQHSTFGLAEPSHGDVPEANPESDEYGRYEGRGSVPDARPNLLDAVRGQGVPLGPPVQRIEHVISTQELGPDADLVRGRVVMVVGNQTPTVLLEQNARRKRALIKVITSASVILLTPMRQGGTPNLTVAPTAPGAFYPLATGDPVHEVKSGAGVDAYGAQAAAGQIMVAIWEELQQPGHEPGLV